MTWEWLSSWWRIFGPGRELLLLASRPERGAAPAALAPLMLSREGGVRTVRFIGSGVSDSLDFIVPEGDSQSVPAFFDFLLAGPPAWDLLWLGDFIVDEEIIRSVERAASESGLKSGRILTTRAPYLAVEGSWDNFLAGKSRHFRRNLRQKENRIAGDEGKLEVTKTGRELPAGTLAAMRSVERKSWKGRGKDLSPEKRREMEFFDLALPALAAKGWLELRLGLIAGRPAAFQINFDLADKIWGYNIGFDREYSHLSPGVLLMKSSIEDAFRSGRREYDFLRGEETFKMSWTGTARDVVQLVLYRPNLRSRLACAWATGWLRNARRLRSRIRSWIDRRSEER